MGRGFEPHTPYGIADVAAGRSAAATSVGKNGRGPGESSGHRGVARRLLIRMRGPRPDRPATSLRRVVGRMVAFALSGHAVSLTLLVLVVAVISVSVQPRLDALRDASDAAHSAHDGMLDQQTGVRAYLATGEEVFLEAYEEGREEVAAADDDLVQALSGEPELLSAFVETSQAQRRWQEEWAGAGASGDWRARADTDGDGTISTPELTVHLREGKALFDAYRAAEDALEGAIDAAVESREDNVRWAMAVVALVLALIGAVSVVVLVRSRRRLQRSVLGPVTELTDAAARVEHGDLDQVSVARSEVRELNDLAGGLEVMTARLAERAAVAAEREQELVRRSDRLHHVLELSRELSESLSLRYTTLRLMSAVQELSGAVHVELWLRQAERQELVHYDPHGGSTATIALAPDETGDPHAQVVEVGIGAVGRAARYGRAIPLDERRAAQVGEEPLQGVAIPMVIGAQVTGVLTLEAAEGEFLDLDLLDALILQGSTALQAARLHGEVEERSRRDALTGLANRRQFDEDLASDVARAARYHRPLSLVMIDLDHFKRINDTYGHARGDEVLQDVAGMIQREVRDADTAYRYGGEELCILMPETDAVSAAAIVERLRARVAKSFAWATESPVSMSAGVAELGDIGDGAWLVGAADRALYAAKQGGRDRVELATGA